MNYPNPNDLKITEPTLLIDDDTAKKNIKNMRQRAERSNVIFRPHFKTHQSREVAQWYREQGVSKITVSSLKMAEFFANDGWDDITVAFPANIREKERINDLVRKIHLNLLVESVESIYALDQLLETDKEIDVYLKIDVGTHRTGVDPSNRKSISELISALDDGNHLKFKGFLGHAGHSYKSHSAEEIKNVYSESIELFRQLNQEFQNGEKDYINSLGDTPTCSHFMYDQDYIGEIRPGNFLFYDLMQKQIGSCDWENIAVAMACPVVAKHPERSELVVHGGAVHFSKDYISWKGQKMYGMVVERNGNSWKPIDQRIFLHRLSQDHGKISAPQDFVEKVNIGDLIQIVPAHSCLTVSAMRGAMTLEGQKIDVMI
ncbi:MAG: alanine racemase [Bacteroidota bacterium]